MNSLCCLKPSKEWSLFPLCDVINWRGSQGRSWRDRGWGGKEEQIQNRSYLIHCFIRWKYLWVQTFVNFKLNVKSKSIFIFNTLENHYNLKSEVLFSYLIIIQGCGYYKIWKYNPLRYIKLDISYYVMIFENWQYIFLP